MKKEFLKIICISGFIIFFAFFLVVMISESCNFNKKRKTDAIENPPSQNWLEEDLELYFFSTGLDVIGFEISDDEIENEIWLYGVVREIETEKYYMFAYKLEDCGSIFNPRYVWRFSHKHEVTKERLEHDLWR